MTPKGNPDDIESRINVLDLVNSKSYDEEDLSWISPANMEHSLKFLANLPDKYSEIWPDKKQAFENISGRKYRIADIGCGRGKFAELLASEYSSADIFGIDLSAEAIKSTILKLDDYENGFAVGGDVTELLSELGEFDFIYAVNMIQDTSNPVQTIEHIENNLRSGGYLAVTVPGEEALETFPEHREHDEDMDLPYMIMEDIEAGEENIVWKQYAFPEEKFRGIIKDTKLEIKDKRELTADAGGMPHLMKMLGKEEKVEEAKKIAKTQKENPEKGPKVEFYLLEKMS